jgi:hypothetical protein
MLALVQQEFKNNNNNNNSSNNNSMKKRKIKLAGKDKGGKGVEIY